MATLVWSSDAPRLSGAWTDRDWEGPRAPKPRASKPWSTTGKPRKGSRVTVTYDPTVAFRTYPVDPYTYDWGAE